MYWSVVWCSGGCSWKCYKTLTFRSLLTRCTIPCACHAKRHLNLQKWSVHGVFCTFWLGNVLRATTACTFSTSELPKVVREWCALCILTWKCASRHNGVQVFISHLASWLRTRRFSEPTFRPSGATNHWKNTVDRDFPTFSRICIFFLLTLSLLLFSLLIFLFSLTLSISAFHLSILSEVWLLNFLRSSAVSSWVCLGLLKIRNVSHLLPRTVWPHCGVLTVSVKTRCSIEVFSSRPAFSL